MSETKGERLLNGIEKMREGLDLISQLGDSQELMRLIVGSPNAAKRIKDALSNDSILNSVVISMVAARNGRLTAQTVEKVILDFLDVLFDLSQPAPVQEMEAANADE